MVYAWTQRKKWAENHKHHKHRDQVKTQSHPDPNHNVSTDTTEIAPIVDKVLDTVKIPVLTSKKANVGKPSKVGRLDPYIMETSAHLGSVILDPVFGALNKALGGTNYHKPGNTEEFYPPPPIS